MLLDPPPHRPGRPVGDGTAVGDRGGVEGEGRGVGGGRAKVRGDRIDGYLWRKKCILYLLV